jgi:hypothetical protein
VPLLSLDVIRSTWNTIAPWTSAEADRGAKRLVDRQPIVNAAVLALTEDAGEEVASFVLSSVTLASRCYS